VTLQKAGGRPRRLRRLPAGMRFSGITQRIPRRRKYLLKSPAS
jgi:hypothetical protein